MGHLCSGVRQKKKTCTPRLLLILKVILNYERVIVWEEQEKIRNSQMHNV
jgi:hypothetical protein